MLWSIKSVPLLWWSITTILFVLFNNSGSSTYDFLCVSTTTNKVSAKDISENLDKQHQIKVDKKKIDLKETIKTLGVHNVDVKLYEGVSGVIKVDVRG